uniref:Uncharacterized protein n=1 Tax=Streptomyces ambofaciens TaxID=1889 RepID=Q0JWE0_STRAM|nr:conserved hypothetical protein [Streptomyces ambofaciens]CAK51226.1 conserved hypothetical protein [Streptomyces ambofaciens]
MPAPRGPPPRPPTVPPATLDPHTAIRPHPLPNRPDHPTGGNPTAPHAPPAEDDAEGYSVAMRRPPTDTTTDQAPADPTTPDDMPATQPIGYWSGLAHRAVTRHPRDAMARIGRAGNGSSHAGRFRSAVPGCAAQGHLPEVAAVGQTELLHTPDAVRVQREGAADPHDRTVVLDDP